MLRNRRSRKGTEYAAHAGCTRHPTLPRVAQCERCTGGCCDSCHVALPDGRALCVSCAMIVAGVSNARPVGRGVMTPLGVEITGRRDATRVSATGEIDFGTQGELERTMIDLSSDQRPLELDLSGVSFIDSSGLAMLLSMRNRCAECGGMLTLHAPSEQVRRVLELAGLSAAFTIVEEGPPPRA